MTDDPPCDCTRGGVAATALTDRSSDVHHRLPQFVPLSWLQCAAGALAGGLHTKATTASLRAHLINVPARIATSGRRPTLHLPRDWPWETGWQQLFDAVTTTGPPTATAA